MLHRYFFSRFQCFFRKNRKKSANFLQFFLLVYQQVRRKLKKKFVKTLDKILKCRIFASSLKIKQQIKTTKSNNNKKNKETKKMETNERTIETTYLTAVNWLNNSRILCNEICNIDETFWENCRFDIEEGYEIFQFFLTNCSQSDVEYLEQHFGLLFSYSELLDLYVLCVDHYGTSWDCVPCYTDIEMAAKKTNN